ncbi:MAG: DUF2617 family protein [Planctomycetota bacterium]
MHPEHFTMRNRRVIRHGAYDIELWVMRGEHAVRFGHRDACLTEAVGRDGTRLPESGMVTSFACNGEHDFDRSFNSTGLSYMTTVQSEQLSENLFEATLAEMRDYAEDAEAAVEAWGDESGENLTVVDFQRFSKEVHVQCYHLIASGGHVLRSQTIFEHG